MKIGIITNLFPSVSETFVTNKVLELCKRGHEVVVFRNQSQGVLGLEEFYSLNSIKGLKIVSVYRSPIVEILKKPWLFLLVLQNKKRQIPFLQQERIFNNNKCDVYHFEFSGLAIQYIPLLKKLAGKTVVSCRGTAEKVKPVTEQGRTEQLKKLFQVVDRIHCVSDDMSNTVKRYGGEAHKIFLNKPAVDPVFFLRKEEYSTTDRVVLSVGRLTFQKGYLLGLLAFKEVTKEFPSIKWIIIGEGPARDEIIFYISSLNLQENVILAGKKNRDEVFEYYNASRVFFLPSVSEGIANTVLEAMSMELPVVASRAGGMAEVIEHAVDGLLSDVYDHTHLAFNLKQVLNDITLAKTLATNARKKIESGFSLKRQVDIFEQEYNRLKSG